MNTEMNRQGFSILERTMSGGTGGGEPEFKKDAIAGCHSRLVRGEVRLRAARRGNPKSALPLLPEDGQPARDFFPLDVEIIMDADLIKFIQDGPSSNSSRTAQHDTHAGLRNHADPSRWTRYRSKCLTNPQSRMTYHDPRRTRHSDTIKICNSHERLMCAHRRG
jgi:hypothetical protein